VNNEIFIILSTFYLVPDLFAAIYKKSMFVDVAPVLAAGQNAQI
jgi:hypothetical protein